MGSLRGVDCALESLQVGHHGTHHSSRESAPYEEGAHHLVGGVDPIAEEVVHELLGQAADFHVGVHVEVLDEEAVGFHHLPDGDYIGMDLTP